MTLSAETQAWINQRRKVEEARQAEERVEFFASFSGRVPDLEFMPPDCPSCSAETCYEDGAFFCYPCCLSWTTNGQDGSFEDEDAALNAEHPRGSSEPMNKSGHSVEFEEAFDTLGVKAICSCGWESRLCVDMNQAHMEWTSHLPADRRII